MYLKKQTLKTTIKVKNLNYLNLSSQRELVQTALKMKCSNRNPDTRAVLKLLKVFLTSYTKDLATNLTLLSDESVSLVV